MVVLVIVVTQRSTKRETCTDAENKQGKSFQVLDRLGGERERDCVYGFKDSRGETCPNSYQQQYSLLLLHDLEDPKGLCLSTY